MNRLSKINGFQFFIFIADSFFQRKSYSEELQNIKNNNNNKDNDRADLAEARVEGLGLLSQLHHFSFFFFFLKESSPDYYLLLLILNR